MRSEFPERDRLDLARTWLHVPSGDKGNPVEWTEIVKVRDLVLARLDGATNPTTGVLASMLDQLIGSGSEPERFSP